MLGTVQERAKVLSLRRRSNFISAEIDEGVGFETRVKVFPALNFTLCLDPLCHKNILLKDLLELHSKKKIEVKIPSFVLFFSVFQFTSLAEKLFFQQLIIWKCIVLWLPLPLNYLRNFHVRKRTYY